MCVVGDVGAVVWEPLKRETSHDVNYLMQFLRWFDIIEVFDVHVFSFLRWFVKVFGDLLSFNIFGSAFHARVVSVVSFSR